MSTLLKDPSVSSIVAVAALFLIWLALALIIRVFERRNSILRRSLAIFRSVVLPLAAVLYFLVVIEGISDRNTPVRIIATLFWVTLIWVGTLLIKVLLLARLERRGLEEQRTPALLIDLIRFPLAILAVFFVLVGVWESDFGNLLATLGVGSLVLGLALQDTLGNLFAGIALFFEKPFAVGHWIRVGEVVGKIVELNWRAVRVLTRNGDLVVIPNSVLGKERIENYSIPSEVHATLIRIAFSYDDPPNKVKAVLCACARATRRVLADPAPLARTVGYGDSAINYDVKFFIRDFAALPDIEEELFTRIWYAARRNGLTIPFPIRTVFKTDMPPKPATDPARAIDAAVRTVDLFAPLSKEETAELTREAVIEEYAAGEKILSQGEKNRAFFIIRSGKAMITLTAARGAREDLAVLSAGQFFGEMSVLTGEDCAADVVAVEDINAVVVYKETLEVLLGRRPELAEQMAHIIAARKLGLHAAAERAQHGSAEAAAKVRGGAGELVGKIRKFFGLSASV